MAEIPEPDFERDLAAYLRRESGIPVLGLSTRVVQRVREQRRRSQIIRWTSLATACAACFTLALIWPNQSNSMAPSVVHSPAQLIAESLNESDWVNEASDLTLIAPLMDNKNSIVSEVLNSTDI